MRHLLLLLLLLGNQVIAQSNDWFIKQPPNPNPNVKVWQKQLLLYNMNIVIDKAKAADSSVKFVANTAQQVQAGTIGIPKVKDSDTHIELDSGCNIPKATVYGILKSQIITLNSNVDFINSNYQIGLGKGIVSLSYSAPFTNRSYNLNVGLHRGW